MQIEGAQREGGMNRHAWLDHARGIGIVLVVYAHQMRAQAAIGRVPSAWDGPFQDALIYSFHMPLFFFISGIVSLKSIQSKPFADSLGDKLKSIAYPYFLWSIISWCLSALAVNYVNKPLDFHTLLSIVYEPILQYWFLYVLFFCQLVALIFRRLFIATVVIAGMLLVVPLPFINPTINEFVASFPFFVIGMAASAYLLAPRDHRSWRWEALSAGAALAVFVVLVLIRSKNTAFLSPVALFQAWSGIAFIIMISQVIGPRWSWLSALGQGSMAIFVLHTIVAATVRTGLGLLGQRDPLVMLVACVIAGLLVPLIVARIATSYRVAAWLGLGKSERRITDAERPTALAVP
jgi:fucose 4-O-acetylase-like acetyltransferase